MYTVLYIFGLVLAQSGTDFRSNLEDELIKLMETLTLLEYNAFFEQAEVGADPFDTIKAALETESYGYIGGDFGESIGVYRFNKYLVVYI